MLFRSLGLRHHLGVVERQKLPRLRQLFLFLGQTRGQLDQRAEPAMFASKLGEPPSVL